MSWPRIIRATLFALGVSVFSVSASAGGGVWASGGPPGGFVTRLAIAPGTPSTLYAGAAQSWGQKLHFYRSTDSGGSWATVPGIPDFNLNALAIDPRTPSIVYAAMTGSGVWRSTDSGESWIQRNAGLPPLDMMNVYALAIDPASPATLYAGGDAGRLFKTIDAGDSWAAAGNAPGSFSTITIDPASPSTLYVIANGLLVRSTDSGLTWTSLVGTVTAFAMDQMSTSTLYVGAARGLLKSTDAGSTWFPSAGVYDYVHAIVMDPSTPSTLYVGTRELDDMVLGTVFKSTDAGGSWSHVSLGLNTGVLALAIDPATPSTLYAGMVSGGVIKSLDAGATWSLSSTGLAKLGVRALVVDPASSTLFAGTGEFGIFKSTDSGDSWIAGWRGASTTPSKPWISSLAISRSTPSTMYAGTRGFEATLYKSTDSGATWTVLINNMMGATFSAIAVAPDSASNVFVAVTNGCSVKKWTGLGFTTVLDQCVYALAIDPVTPSSLYASGWKSTDSGDTWAVMSDLAGLTVNALVLDPVTPSVLYAGTGESGLFRSTDSGDSWIAANTGLTNLAIRALTIDSAFPFRIYAGTDDGVFQSANSGATWTTFGTGGPISRRVSALATRGAAVFAGFYSEGVWQTSSTYDLTLSITGNGDVLQEADTAGASCGYRCVSYPSGTVVTLTPFQNGFGYRFASWGGACSGSGTCTLTMDADKSVSATFVPSFNLITLSAGTGTGTITNSPPGAGCGTGCTNYFAGTVVTLTATPGPSSTFTSWSGACSGSGPCSVTMDASRSVTATFSAQLSSGARLYTVTPCRRFDSRIAEAGTPIPAGATHTIVLTGASCGIPASATSAAVNVTVTQPSAPGFVRVYAFGDSVPNTSNLNFRAGLTRANNAILRLPEDATGRVNVVNASSGTVHVIVDVSGYFE